MSRYVAVAFIALLVGGAFFVKESAARTPQENLPDWYKYEAVRKVYKLGMPVGSATEVIYYDLEKGPKPAYEDVVLLLYTKTIGVIPIRVRRYFDKAYDDSGNFDTGSEERAQTYLKQIKSHKELLDKVSGDNLKVMHDTIRFDVSAAWMGLNDNRKLKVVGGMAIMLGSPLRVDQIDPLELSNSFTFPDPALRPSGTFNEGLIEAIGQFKRAKKVLDSLYEQAREGKRPPEERFESASREVYSAETEFALQYMYGYQKVVQEMRAALDK